MTQSINELKSYTEYNVSTPTSVFTIGFQYEYNVDHVNVYVNGVEATAAGYNIQHDSQGTVQLTPAVPTGVVRVVRETDIDSSAHTFSAGAKFTAGNMDENFKQIRYSQQEVRDAFDYLEYNTLGVVEAAKEVTERANEAAQDADDAAEAAAQIANDAAARVADKIAELQPAIDSILQEFDQAINTIVVDGGVPALAVSDASGVTQQDINNSIKTPTNYNIPDSEAIDVTAILAQLMNPSGKHVSMLERRTYLIDELIVPPNTILYANGATIKRRRGTGKPLVTVQAGAILIGAIVDGDEDNIGAQLWNGDQGIRLSDGAVAFGCLSMNNHGHGFDVKNNTICIACRSINNGREGGNGAKWGNWGDGFNIINADHGQFLMCTASGNYRNGLSATTYDAVNGTLPDYQNPELCRGVKVISCHFYDNIYIDCDLEGVVAAQVVNTESQLYMGNSSDMLITNHTGEVYGGGCDNAIINGVRVDREQSSTSFYLKGRNPTVSNINISGKSGVSQGSIACEIIATDSRGSVNNVTIDNAYNAVVTNVRNFNGLNTSGISNTVFNYDYRVLTSQLVRVENGAVHYRTNGLVVPSLSRFVAGDTMYNTSSSGDYALVCTKSGQATNTVWESGASVTLNSIIYSGVNVYKVTTSGVLGTTAPNHTSGTVANGTAQLEYISQRAEFKTIAYKTDPVVGVSAIVPASITNANDIALVGKFYWVDSALANMPLPTSGSFTKANIETYNAYRLLSGNNAITQEVNYPYLNEKWVRAYDGGIGSWSTWTLVHTKNSSGTTSNRPSGNVPIGFKYFDTTLNKPIYLKSAGVWVDATGANV